MEILSMIALGALGLIALAVGLFLLWLAVRAADIVIAVVIAVVVIPAGLFVAGMMDFYIAAWDWLRARRMRWYLDRLSPAERDKRIEELLEQGVLKVVPNEAVRAVDWVCDAGPSQQTKLGKELGPKQNTKL